MAVAPSARALITLDEYKRLSRDPSVAPASQSTEMDDYYQSLINQVGAVFRAYCRLPLILETFTDEPHDGRGTATLWLRSFPVVTKGTGAPTVREDAGAGVVTLVSGTDFQLRRNGELIRWRFGRAYAWSDGFENVLVTYKAGRWADTVAVDDDIKAFAVQAVDWLHGIGPAAWGNRMTDAGIIRPDDMPKPIKLGLKPYVRPARV